MAVTVTGRRERRPTAKGAKQQEAPPRGPNEDEIRILAFRLYERRLVEGVSGDAASDWIEAERLLVDELAEVGRPPA